MYLIIKWICSQPKACTGIFELLYGSGAGSWQRNSSHKFCIVGTSWRKERVTDNQCLSFRGIALCDAYLPAPQVGDWSYNELNPKYMYADTKKINPYTLILDLICIKFLDNKSLFFN